MHDKLSYIIKHYAFVQWLYKTIMSFVFRTLGLFVPNDEKLVLLSSMSGDQYSDSPRVLFETMIKDPRFKDFHYVWAFNYPDCFRVPVGKKVKMDSLAYFKTALKAKIWITNVNIERGLKFKKKNTIYLNTWHGTGPKKGGNAVKGRNDYDFSYVDIVCVDGDYAMNEMVKWFNADPNHLLWCGRPREDELFTFNEQTKKELRNKIGIPKEKKVLLYMPTWRENGNLILNSELWEKELSDEYVLLVRMHHFAKKTIVSSNADFWLDVSNYSNVNHLYCVADILISDYSSAFFDYGLLGKPMICFGYDYEQYELENGFLMDLKNEFPSGIKRTEKEVIEYIKTMDYDKESFVCKKYCNQYVKHPGNATEACLNRIYELLNQ